MINGNCIVISMKLKEKNVGFNEKANVLIKNIDKDVS
jgi:hypothetical protein